jgi:CheY-like chemotaxis protein
MLCAMLLGLVADLFFATRIRETARQLGIECAIERDPARLAARAVELSPSVIIADMSLRGGDPAAAVRALKADERTRAIPVVGYLFDSDEDGIRVARAAGCDKVLSRGGLTKRLPEIIAGAA